MNISAGFKVVMARYGVSSNSLAKKMGISNRAVAAAIGERSIKKVDVVIEFCHAIGCSMSELIEEAEKASTTPEKRINKVDSLISALDDELFPCVYHLKNNIGKVVYVGQTNDLKRRLKEHIQKAEFYGFSYRKCTGNLDDEEMLDIIKFNPVINQVLMSTKKTPKVKDLKASITRAINHVDFSPSVTRKAERSDEFTAHDNGLITREKHDYIVKTVIESLSYAIAHYDSRQAEKKETGDTANQLDLLK